MVVKRVQIFCVFYQHSESASRYTKRQAVGTLAKTARVLSRLHTNRRITFLRSYKKIFYFIT